MIQYLDKLLIWFWWPIQRHVLIATINITCLHQKYVFSIESNPSIWCETPKCQGYYPLFEWSNFRATIWISEQQSEMAWNSIQYSDGLVTLDQKIPKNDVRKVWFSNGHTNLETWWILKQPPLNPRDYKSRTSKISPREECLKVRKNVRKSSKNRKKVDHGLFPIKKVDKDAICQSYCLRPQYCKHRL